MERPVYDRPAHPTGAAPRSGATAGDRQLSSRRGRRSRARSGERRTDTRGTTAIFGPSPAGPERDGDLQLSGRAVSRRRLPARVGGPDPRAHGRPATVRGCDRRSPAVAGMDPRDGAGLGAQHAAGDDRAGRTGRHPAHDRSPVASPQPGRTPCARGRQRRRTRDHGVGTRCRLGLGAGRHRTALRDARSHAAVPPNGWQGRMARRPGGSALRLHARVVSPGGVRGDGRRTTCPATPARRGHPRSCVRRTSRGDRAAARGPLRARPRSRTLHCAT